MSKKEEISVINTIDPIIILIFEHVQSLVWFSKKVFVVKLNKTSYPIIKKARAIATVTYKATNFDVLKKVPKVMYSAR